jgi:replicative DNA helicase
MPPRFWGRFTCQAGGNWDHPITGDTFHDAEQLGRYYLAHALAAFDLMGADPDLEAARTVLTWIQRTGAPTFTRRDAFTVLRSNRFPKVTDLDPALTLLTEHGHIRLGDSPTNGKRGRQTVVYEVHPCHAETAETAETQT